MTKPTELNILRFAAALVLGLLLGAVLLGVRAGRQPAAPQGNGDDPRNGLARPADLPAPAEAKSGGVLERGVWHFGYRPDPEATKRFVKSLARPTLAEAGPDTLDKAQADKPVLLYRALYEAYAASHGGDRWYVGQQGIGDCVSWGWGHGGDVHLAVQWKLGETSEWRPAATEAIYGGSRVEARNASRGGYSDGSYGGAAAKWVRDWGFVYRQPYPELDLDLSEYSARRAKTWGNFGCGGEGDNGRLDQVAKSHPARSVVLIRTFREAAAAIQAGYPVPVCSGQGFSAKRDEQGFSRPSGSWSHCMCAIAVRFDRPGVLILNSWGTRWISGPKWPEDQPDGSFWCDATVFESMLRGEDSFSLSAVEGFPFRNLAHGDWVLVEPASVREYHRRLAAKRLWWLEEGGELASRRGVAGPHVAPEEYAQAP